MEGGLPQFVRRRLDPEQRYGLRLSLFAAALVLVAVPFATLVFQVIGGGRLTRLDGSLADGLNDAVHRSPAVIRVFDAVSLLGRPVVLALVVAGAALILVRRGCPRLALYLVVTALLGGVVDVAVKALVDRPRPLVDHPVATAFGKSFPSGHAMNSVVTYGALLLAFLPAVVGRWRRAAIAVTALLVVLVGCSRLLLGVHFLTDVVGGYVLGLAWLAAATAAFAIWREDRRTAAMSSPRRWHP
jgi:membrane-associated phospholipid phosphatase